MKTTTFTEHILNLLFKRREIVNCDRDLYLIRWFVIRTKHLGLFIHKFVRSDEDRALHDHPWSFLVIPIWRGYWEHYEIFGNHLPPGRTFKCRRVLPILGARIRQATYRHRVELIDGKPSWSLFFRFRKRREWGFWMPEGFVHWNTFWQDKCE